MKCVVYLSIAESNITDEALSLLTSKAASKNQRLGVTGFLCFARGRFLQYLEGDDQTIESLLQEIKQDSRHDVVFDLEHTAIEKRLFSSWAMRLISESELSKYNFELQIEQNLLYIKNNFGFKERCEKFVWQHILQMSRLKKYIDIYGQ